MAMEGANIVCSMCGDVGFADKIFQCIRCHSRFQHSYCTNYYDERSTAVCDWCLSEERSALKHGLQYSKKPAGRDGAGSGGRFECTGSDKVKENGDQQEEGGHRGKTGASSSSKPTGRRYKLLKDVLC